MGAKPVSLRIKSVSVNGVYDYEGTYNFFTFDYVSAFGSLDTDPAINTVDCLRTFC